MGTAPTPSPPLAASISEASQSTISSSSSSSSANTLFGVLAPGSHVRRRPTIADVTPTPAGLLELMREGAWRSVIKLAATWLAGGVAQSRSSSALSSPSSSSDSPLDPDLEMQYRLCVVIAHLKLHMHKHAQEKLQQLLSLRRRRAEQGQVQSAPLPYSVHVLAAELPAYTGNTVRSLDLLHTLLHKVRIRLSQLREDAEQERVLDLSAGTADAFSALALPTPPSGYSIRTLRMPGPLALDINLDYPFAYRGSISSSSSSPSSGSPRSNSLSSSNHQVKEVDGSHSLLSMWRRREDRLQLSICARLLEQGEYVCAAEQLSQLSQRHPANAVLEAARGRVLLQLGAVHAATKAFSRCQKLLEVVHGVHVASGGGDGEDGGDAAADKSTSSGTPTPPDSSSTQAHTLLHMNRAYLALSAQQYPVAADCFDRVLQRDADNLVAANNRAVCWLFTCELGRAIQSLEQVVRRDPARNLNNTLVFNLCTLYDLRSENAVRDKKQLMQLAARYGSDAFDPSVLKLPL
jgi:tetratricopeptide (TPR) repeat protein